ERRKHLRDAQNTTLRTLVATRHLPSDPAYSTAINMIPIDFNSVPAVMRVLRSHIEVTRYAPSPENTISHNNQIIASQTALIFEMCKHLGYKLSETEIQTSPYASGGFIQRDNLMLDGWRAWPRIAAALEAQLNLISPQPSEPNK
ncbi:MAG: DUF6680 family protein, partial [Novosphingobium sp.]